MITVVFGLPGSGKSTMLVRNALKQAKKGLYERVYVNIPLNHVKEKYKPGHIRYIDPDWLGVYDLHDCAIHLDEGSLLFDSRDYKNFGKRKLYFFLMHRHYNIDLWIYVQQWDALDIKIRNITNEVYWCSNIGFGITAYRRVPYLLYFAGDTNASHGKPGEIKMGYTAPGLLSNKFFIRRKWYKYFDTYIRDELPNIPVDKSACIDYNPIVDADSVVKECSELSGAAPALPGDPLNCEQIDNTMGK